MQRIYPVLFIVIALSARGFTPYKTISPADYIDLYKNVALEEMSKHGIPASIILGQGMVESDYGNSTLAVKANNHFGLKCHKEWHGPTYKYDDDMPAECFRKYDKVMDSYFDHSIFIKSRPRYGFLFSLALTDYRGWANGLKTAGYATHPEYAKKVIDVIEKYRLYELDQSGFISTPVLGLEPAGSKQEKQLPVFNKHEIIRYNHTSFIILKQGDTYDKVAREFGIEAEILRKYNNQLPEKEFFEGGVLYVQPKHDKGSKPYHIVGEDETMESISQVYAIELSSLYQKNLMQPGDPQPKPGTMLFLRRQKPLPDVEGRK
jgi:hypothetical protein